MSKYIIRAKGGTKERRVLVSKLRVPDVWDIVYNQPNTIRKRDAQQLIECWHLCHDLLRAMQETEPAKDQTGDNGTVSRKFPFDPDYNIAPGDTLAETISEMGISREQLAVRMGQPVEVVNQIIRGRADITGPIARQIELVTGVPARFWNRAQHNYAKRKTS